MLNKILILWSCTSLILLNHRLLTRMRHEQCIILYNNYDWKNREIEFIPFFQYTVNIGN